MCCSGIKKLHGLLVCKRFHEQEQMEVQFAAHEFFLWILSRHIKQGQAASLGAAFRPVTTRWKPGSLGGQEGRKDKCGPHCLLCGTSCPGQKKSSSLLVFSMIRINWKMLLTVVNLSILCKCKVGGGGNYWIPRKQAYLPPNLLYPSFGPLASHRLWVAMSDSCWICCSDLLKISSCGSSGNRFLIHGTLRSTVHIKYIFLHVSSYQTHK